MPQPTTTSPCWASAETLAEGFAKQIDMTTLFLHGGGDHIEARQSTFGRFLDRCKRNSSGPVAVVSAAGERAEAAAQAEAYIAILQASNDLALPMTVLPSSPDAPLRAEELAAIEPAAVFVCGGETPHYQKALTRDREWLAYMRENRLIYCGTSSGASVAAARAIIGGWRTPEPDARDMIYAGAGEGLDQLTIMPGLALVSFAVDVHAGQWGTLTRAIQAVRHQMLDEVWAIDENTMVILDEDDIQICGIGHAYHVTAGESGNVTVRTVTATLH